MTSFTSEGGGECGLFWEGMVLVVLGSAVGGGDRDLVRIGAFSGIGDIDLSFGTFDCGDLTVKVFFFDPVLVVSLPNTFFFLTTCAFLSTSSCLSNA